MLELWCWQHGDPKERKCWLFGGREKAWNESLGAFPGSGSGGNIMFEKLYQALVPLGGVNTNILCVYLSISEWFFKKVHAICLEKQSPRAFQNKFVESWLTSSCHSIFHLFCASFRIPSLTVCLYFLCTSSPFALLFFSCLQTSNCGSCVNAFNIPTLFIVPSLKSLSVFLPFTTLWLLAHFPSTCSWLGWETHHSFS